MALLTREAEDLQTQLTSRTMKPYYRHIRLVNDNTKFRGLRALTLYVQENKDDHQKIDVGVARCSGKDQFEKAIGRAVASAAERTTIYKRDLPKLVDGYVNRYYTDFSYLLRDLV